MAHTTTPSRKHITVIWHVDDLIVSYDENFEITKFACYLSSVYEPKMTMYMGRKHNYLGVIYKFEDKKVEVLMFNFLDRAIDDFHQDSGPSHL